MDTQRAYIDEHFDELAVEAMNDGYLRDIRLDPFKLQGGSVMQTQAYSTGSEASIARWGEPTHSKIADRIRTILYNDQKTSAYNFINTYFSDFEYGNRQPDTDEYEVTTHYYVYTGTPSTVGAYYKNRSAFLNPANYSISARTRFEEHYNMAVQFYAYNQALSAELLGRAMHYLSDMCSVPHAVGKSGTRHTEYETYVDSNFDNFYMLNYGQHYSFVNNNLYQGIMNYIISQIGDSQFKTWLENGTNYNIMAEVHLTLNFSIGAAVASRFMNDVQSTSSFPKIYNNQVYYLKNVGSGQYMSALYGNSANGTKIVQFSNYGGAHQKFKAVFNSDKTISFVPMHTPTKFMSINDTALLTYLRINEASWNNLHKFKLAIDDYKRFRILTKPELYKNNIISEGNNPEGNLIEAHFNPDSLYHYWVFEIA